MDSNHQNRVSHTRQAVCINVKCNMMDKKAIVEIMSCHQMELIEWPIKKVVGGNPQAKYRVVSQSKDSTSFSGIWECTPGRFEVNYSWDEMTYVLEGLVSIEEEDGTIRQFKAGDVVHFPVGLKCTWEVHETIKKVYAIFSTEPFDL